MESRILTVLISDLQGYTARQAQSSRAQIAAELTRHRELLLPIYEAFGGEVVKSMGDAFLVTFASPTQAVLAAAQVQKRLSAADAREAGLAVRIAVTTGEVTRDARGDVFGEPVNLAARLQAAGEPGQVWLTEATFLAMNRNEVQALEVGARVFKGIPGEVKVYRVLDECIANTRLLAAGELQPRQAAAGRRRGLVAAGVLLLLVALLPLLLRGEPGPDFVALRRELYTAQATGTISALYSQTGPESWYGQHIARHLPSHKDDLAYQWLRATWHMLQEPLVPGAAELVLEVIEKEPLVARDAEFKRLLVETVDYAQKDPAVQARYQQALQRLGGR